MTIIETIELAKFYEQDNKGSKGYKVKALDRINLTINKNEFIGIMGKSGCGKTTLLRILGGIDKETSGQFIFNGTELSKIKEDKLAQIRRKEIGFVFQDFYLMDSLSIKENIMLPMILDHINSDVINKKVIENSERFGIKNILEKYPYEVSGGEKQRAAICRAISNDPSLILADEPTGNLDSASAKIVMDCFETMHQSLDKTILIVTHDPYIASHCKRVLFMKDGEIVGNYLKEGSSEAFFDTILKKMITL